MSASDEQDPTSTASDDPEAVTEPQETEAQTTDPEPQNPGGDTTDPEPQNPGGDTTDPEPQNTGGDTTDPEPQNTGGEPSEPEQAGTEASPGAEALAEGGGSGADRFRAREFSDLEAKPARELTRAEARDLCVHYHLEGYLKLNKGPRGQGVITQPTFDASGKVTWPAASEQLYIEQDVHPDGDEAGVVFRYVDFGNWKKSNFKPLPASLANLHPRTLVLLYRLAKLLSSDHGATQVIHCGIGTKGPNGKAGDCHDTGRAIDLVGVRTGEGGYLTVETDWALVGSFQEGSYRLADTGTAAAQLFEAVYGLATRECNDRHGEASSIGDVSEILHPDHPNARLRRDHQGHMHLDVPE
jgi:hypothetical protein